jgi:hypothetical protein
MKTNKLMLYNYLINLRTNKLEYIEVISAEEINFNPMEQYKEIETNENIFFQLGFKSSISNLNYKYYSIKIGETRYKIHTRTRGDKYNLVLESINDIIFATFTYLHELQNIFELICNYTLEIPNDLNIEI